MGPDMSPSDTHVPQGSRAAFGTTHWSVVLHAGALDPDRRAQALETLCRLYWYPIYAEIRRRGHAPTSAQDLAQDFFACLLRRNSFGAADSTKGRFRSYLLGALDYFLADAWDRERAQRRGGGIVPISIDALDAESRYESEPVNTARPDHAFDRHWLVYLLDNGLKQMEAEQQAAGKSQIFSCLKPFLASETDVGDYQRVAAELGWKPSTVAVAVHRLRHRYRELIRQAVEQTVSNPEELAEEWRHLFGR